MGYSFDWQTQSLVQTGGFYFKSLPADATIFINNQNQKTTPRLISRLPPKIYSVKIDKNSFYSWQKNLEIMPALITEARNIILFPEILNPEEINNNITSTIPYFLAAPEEKLNQLQAQNIASSSAGWLSRGQDIFYVDRTNSILYRRDFGGFIKEQLSKESLPKETYKVSASTNGRYLALSENNDLFLLNKDTGIFDKIYNQVKNAKFSSDNKKILIQTANELWVLYLEDILIQPYKKAGGQELITRYSRPITQAIFYPDNEHIAFVVDNQIKIIELDGRDRRNSVDFISAPSPQIYFDEPNSYFYYLTQNELFRIKLEL